jgi:hypothetical protein
MADVDDTLLVWFRDKVIKVFHVYSPAAVTNQADVENRTQSNETSIFQAKNVMDPLLCAVVRLFQSRAVAVDRLFRLSANNPLLSLSRFSCLFALG